jgi:PAS domain S-box-containing protein
MTPDAAVFVVNPQGLIVEWSRSAERMYGYSAEQIVGSSLAAMIADPGATTSLQDLVMASGDPEARRSSVHRRSDGTVVHVEFEVKPAGTAEHFTVAVHDLSRRHEIDAFREAALGAQSALQEAADKARRQVEILEALTDPSVNPVAGLPAVAELLERLRSSLRADGVAFVEVGRMGTRIISGAGLRAAQVRAAGGTAGSAPADGRVALVHNDAARVAQVSALTWPSAVSSIMVVPVGQAGQAVFRIEVINERRAPATEWDLALARIVADRFAQVNTQQLAADSSDAVA